LLGKICEFVCLGGRIDETVEYLKGAINKYNPIKSKKAINIIPAFFRVL
jgi:hypothetical protein